MDFKVNFENTKGKATLRSRYTPYPGAKPVSIRYATGIFIQDKKALKKLEVELMDTCDELKALPSEDRVRLYNTPAINLKVIWQRYQEKCRPSSTLGEENGISDEVLVEIARFPESQKLLSDHYTHYHAAMVVRHLSYYAQSQGYSKLFFKDLTRPFLAGYEHYLRETETQFVYEGKSYQKGKLSTATVKKHFAILHRACKYVAGEVEMHPAIHAYAIKNSAPHQPTVSLTYEELIALFEYSQKSEDLHPGVDLWLFMAFSGLRSGKTLELRKSDIANGFINWSNSKNNNEVVCTTIHRYNAAFLKKYLGVPQIRGRLFPQISRTTIRAQINKALRGLNIDKVVGLHSARHTYNNLLQRLPVKDFHRMKELGHQPNNVNEKHYTRDDVEQRQAHIIQLFENLEQFIEKPLAINNLYKNL